MTFWIRMSGVLCLYDERLTEGMFCNVKDRHEFVTNISQARVPQTPFRLCQVAQVSGATLRVYHLRMRIVYIQR